MKVKVTKSGVTFESGVLPVGSELDLPESLADRLVNYGCAEIVEPEQPEQPEQLEQSEQSEKKEPVKRGTKKE